MKPTSRAVWTVLIGWCLAFQIAVRAEHRATHLGHPATRFAPPLMKPDDLRKRFRDEKLRPDIEEILAQWGWQGDLKDLYYAALTAEITEVELPVGTRMPFMSSREKGRPITLRDVVWAGKAPIKAYVFYFSSKERKYRCVTPRPCSNFFLEDLGPELPVLDLQLEIASEVSLCGPIDAKWVVRNTGEAVARRTRISSTLPDGLLTVGDSSAFDLDAGDIKPGTSMEVPVLLKAVSAGRYSVPGRVTADGGITASVEAGTVVTAPSLALECEAPRLVFVGLPAKVCYRVRNIGTGAERSALLFLPVPDGFTPTQIDGGGSFRDGKVVWELPELAAGTEQKLCVTLDTPRRPGDLSLEAEVRGACSQGVQTRSETRVNGVPGILVEVVDAADPVEVGQEVTYLVTVTNQGLAALNNIRVAGLLPASGEFVSATGSTEGQFKDGRIEFAPLKTLKPRTDASWRVVMKALQADDARFNVELRSDEFDRPILEMESTRLY